MFWRLRPQWRRSLPAEVRPTSLECDSAASAQPGSWPGSSHSCPPVCPHWRNMSASRSVQPVSQSQSSYCKCRSAFLYGSPIKESQRGGEIRREAERTNENFFFFFAEDRKKLPEMLRSEKVCFLVYWDRQLSTEWGQSLQQQKKNKYQGRIDALQHKQCDHCVGWGGFGHKNIARHNF